MDFIGTLGENDTKISFFSETEIKWKIKLKLKYR
jgi:hypothetical protein